MGSAVILNDKLIKNNEQEKNTYPDGNKNHRHLFHSSKSLSTNSLPILSRLQQRDNHDVDESSNPLLYHSGDSDKSDKKDKHDSFVSTKFLHKHRRGYPIKSREQCLYTAANKSISVDETFSCSG